MDEIPGGPAGRRANGLPAADWGALVDLDPRLSEGLLDRLAAAGVAAYVEPATAVDTVHRAVLMPGRPLDRLWVDPARAESAREVVSSEMADLSALLAEDQPGATAHGLVQPVPRAAARRVLPPPTLPGPSLPGTALPGPALPDPALPDPSLPGPSLPGPSLPGPAAPASPAVGPGAPAPLDDEAVFQQIIASFSRGTDDPVPRWPASEDLPEATDPPRRRRTDRTAPPPPPPRPGPGLPAWVEPAALDPTEDEGHYVPPPPPPVPRVRARTVAALAAVVLGLLVLFAPEVVGLYQSPGVALLGMALLAGGAGALVWWMRDSSPDSGPDDGAVV